MLHVTPMHGSPAHLLFVQPFGHGVIVSAYVHMPSSHVPCVSWTSRLSASAHVFGGGVLHVMLPQTCGATSLPAWPPRAHEINDAAIATAINQRVPIAAHRYISARWRECEFALARWTAR
jgi:hypothetical protein